MENNFINIYYFSGTGNTLLIVKEMQKFFEENNKQVELFKIESHTPQAIDTNHTIGLAFPVIIQSTHKFIWEFMENIPATETDTEIFMVDTLVKFSGGIISPLKKLLTKKGYKTIGAREIKMPSNHKKKNDNSRNKKIIENGKLAARNYAHDLLFGLTNWIRIPLPNPLSKLSRSEKTLDKLRKIYCMDVDRSKCIRCGSCFKLCPVDNIEMEFYPEFLDKCQICMRCISFCPTEAIFFPHKKIDRYKVVKAEELI